MSPKVTVPMAKQNGTEPTPTPLEEWQRMRLHGTLTMLESTGRMIRWRPVELIRALQQGKIPENLTSYVAKRVWSGNADDTRSEYEKSKDWQDYLDLMATLGLIEPDPAPLLATGDLLYVELVEIEETVTSPAKAVLPFLRKQSRHVDAGTEGSQI